MVDIVKSQLAKLSSADAAGLFLSPYIDDKLFVECLEDPGPAIWIVNRSDVYTQTLEKILKHSNENIAKRAQEKILTRSASLTTFSDPLIERPFIEMDEFEIENLLGHPLVPFEAIDYFLDHGIEDFRASAALSFTRRWLEHPPLNASSSILLDKLKNKFLGMLSADFSLFTRCYLAGIPIYTEQDLEGLIIKEANHNVLARLLQHVSINKKCLEIALEKSNLLCARIIFLNSKLDKKLRVKFKDKISDSLASAINNWYLQ